MRSLLFLVLTITGCGENISGGEDAGEDAGERDAGSDAGIDAGHDGGVSDAGDDAGMDGGADAGTSDAGPADAGSLDAGPLDAGTSDAGPLDAGSDAAPFDAGPFDAGACGTVIATFPIVPAPHVAICSDIVYATTPPTSGPHYSTWAAFREYPVRVPAGFLVHSMEHGAVVVTYNCPAGCDAELTALRAFLDARPADPLCVAPIRNRYILAPDPTLDVMFAAAAWGASLRSACFDLAALGQFLDDHYARAPENFCSDGIAGFPSPCGT